MPFPALSICPIIHPWSSRLSSVPLQPICRLCPCIYECPLGSINGNNISPAQCSVHSHQPCFGEVWRINLPFRVKMTEPAKSSLWDFRWENEVRFGAYGFGENYWWLPSAYLISLVIEVISWLAIMAPKSSNTDDLTSLSSLKFMTYLRVAALPMSDSSKQMLDGPYPLASSF